MPPTADISKPSTAFHPKPIPITPSASLSARTSASDSFSSDLGLRQPVAFRARPCPAPGTELSRPIPLRTGASAHVSPAPSMHSTTSSLTNSPAIRTASPFHHHHYHHHHHHHHHYGFRRNQSPCTSASSTAAAPAASAHGRAMRSWSTGEMRPSCLTSIVAKIQPSALSSSPSQNCANLNSHLHFHSNGAHQSVQNPTVRPQRVVSFGSAVTRQSAASASVSASTSTSGEDARVSWEWGGEEACLRRRRVAAAATFMTSRSNSSSSSVDWSATSVCLADRRADLRPRATITAGSAPREFFSRHEVRVGRSHSLLNGDASTNASAISRLSRATDGPRPWDMHETSGLSPSVSNSTGLGSSGAGISSFRKKSGCGRFDLRKASNDRLGSVTDTLSSRQLGRLHGRRWLPGSGGVGLRDDDSRRDRNCEVSRSGEAGGRDDCRLLADNGQMQMTPKSRRKFRLFRRKLSMSGLRWGNHLGGFNGAVVGHEE